MESSIYTYSLCIALPLMLFFGFDFLFAATPHKAIYTNYLKSRRTMGVALLLLSANYAVHLFFAPRFTNVNAAILMNMSTYFLCYWLFSSALTTLLDHNYITCRRQRAHVVLWLVFSAMSAVVLLLLPGGNMQTAALIAMAVWLMAYGLMLALRLLRAYRRAINIFNDAYSDDIGAYVRWLSVFTYWAVIFGVGCGILTFLPDRYVFIWILSSIPFYIFLYRCYQNYLLFYEQVESVIENDVPSEYEPVSGPVSECAAGNTPQHGSPASYADIEKNVEHWISCEGYVRSGLTIKELSDMMHTNRTYMSGYIKSTYNTNFRDWITGLRIDYAMRMLLRNPELTIADVSERSGFQSASHFIRMFKDRTGCSPAKWKKVNIE